jgi:hypothetical protein
MTAEYDDILDSLFHGCALAAYLDQAAVDGQWPPDSEATRQRAYRYYEEALAEKNRRKSDPQAVDADQPAARIVSYDTTEKGGQP